MTARADLVAVAATLNTMAGGIMRALASDQVTDEGARTILKHAFIDLTDRAAEAADLAQAGKDG